MIIVIFNPAFCNLLILLPLVRKSVSTSPITIFFKFVSNSSSAQDGEVSVWKHGSKLTYKVYDQGIFNLFKI